MSDIEFFAKVSPKRLTSLEEDSRRDQDQFRKDELDRVFRKLGKVKPAAQETSYERFPDES